MGEFNDCADKPFGVTKGQTSIVVTAGAYTDGDVVGGLIEFDVSSGGGGGRITDIYLTDAEGQAVGFTFHIFDTEPTAIADNGAWDTGIDINDLDARILVKTMATYDTDVNTLSSAHTGDIDQDFAQSYGKLWMYAVCTTGPTYGATTDIKISMMVLLN